VIEQTKILKEKVAKVLSELTYVIGYGSGFDPLHARPIFIREENEIEQLVWNRFCIHNLATYLPPQKRPPGWLFDPYEKIGVLVKGCDSRSVGQLLQEGAIKRENLVILGLPCSGMIDVRKLKERINISQVNRLEVDEQTIMVFTETDEISADINELLYDKCQQCTYPNPLIYDELVGEKLEVDPASKHPFAVLEGLNNSSIKERAAFWEACFARCVRCYACRNVCPMCYCQNQCLLETRVPHWLKTQVDVSQNMWFHLIRAFHLAGRCTDCAECARVCPVNIPVNLLTLKMSQELLELFGWQAGIDPEAKPPLMTFQLEEEKIKE